MVNNRIVIDTNVFISALIGQYSYPYKIFQDLVLTGEVTICLSNALLSEYENVMQREKFKKITQFSSKALKLIKVVKSLALRFEPTISINVITDEPDNRLLELAVAANAAVIVTGNTRDFNFDSYQGILIQSLKFFYESFNLPPSV